MTNGPNYQDFSLSLHPLSFEASKRMGTLPRHASYVVSVMHLFEERYFDENGKRRSQGDDSIMHGYQDEELLHLLRGNLAKSLELLSHESNPKGLPISASLGEHSIRTVGSRNYVVLRVPQSIALLYDVDNKQMATLNISPAIKQQVSIEIKKTKIQNTDGPNIVDSLNALSLEVGVNELSRIIGRTAQTTEYVFYKIEK